MSARWFPFVLLIACNENDLLSLVDTANPSDTGAPDVVEPDPEVREPVADAGTDLTVGRGETVHLDGSASYDPDGLAPLTYAWTVNHAPTDTTSTPSSLTVVAPIFTADVIGTWVFDLTVQNTAGVWDSTPARVVVHVESQPPAPAPIANAGPDRNVNIGNPANIDGSGSSDPQGLYPLAFEWSIVTAPSGSTATLSGSGPAISLVPDVNGDYTVQLGVKNTAGTADPTPDRMVIHATTPPIAPPVSDAGVDIAAYRGDLVPLTGLASYDPGGYTPLTYAWSPVAVPSGSASTLDNTASATPSFVPDKVGTYTFDLAVTNSLGTVDATPDRVRVTVTAPPVQPPIANAGVDQSVSPLVNVTLDGTASSDPQGLTPLTYQWTLITKPSGSTTHLSSQTASRPTFFADLAGRYEFDLDVRNSAGTWDGTPDRVVVDAVPADGFYVEVSWDSTADLDLHVLNGTTGIFGAGDCSYCNMTPSWAGSGTADDPSLDADAIFGYGPETTTITSPASGNYDIKVHYYGTGGSSSCSGTCPSSMATARVYLGGVLAATYTKRLTQDDQVWNVARLAWPSRVLTVDNSVTTTALTFCQ